MSLQVWLPLTNGTLKQQGLKNAAATIDGTVGLTDAGKLGKCATIGTTAGRITLPASTMTSFTECSVAFWIKIISWNTSYATFFQAGLSSAAWNNYIFGILRNNANSNLCFTLTNSSGSSSSAAYTTSNLNTGQWYHLAFTYKAGTICTYIDGTLDKTYSTTYVPNFAGITNISIGKGTNNSSYQTNCNLNDFRIYDHCLSPMEVKELAKGLVLHYPLNRGGWGQENLASRYVTCGSNNPNNQATAGRTNFYGDYGIIIPTTENVDTYFSIWYNTPLESGKTYTLSAQVSGLLNGSYYNFPLFAQNNSSMGLFKIDHNGLVSLTFTMNYTGTIATYTIDNKTHYRMFMDDITRSIASGQGPITITNIKLENGEQHTPWCPNSADTLATTMGLNSTIEYDCSGFCNNGTWHGTHTNTSDTPKYAVSTTATGSGTTYLEGPVLPAEAKTVALWIKNTSKSSNGAIFNDKTSGLQIGLLNSLLYMNSAASTAGFTTTHWVNGEWNHVVAVNNNGTRSLYVNGQAETQSGASNYYIHNADNCWLWNRSYNNNYPFTGSLCDLRVYATALSADDVKSLYQNCATIDPDGTIRGQIRS